MVLQVFYSVAIMLSMANAYMGYCHMSKRCLSMVKFDGYKQAETKVELKLSFSGRRGDCTTSRALFACFDRRNLF